MSCGKISKQNIGAIVDLWTPIPSSFMHAIICHIEEILREELLWSTINTFHEPITSMLSLELRND